MKERTGHGYDTALLEALNRIKIGVHDFKEIGGHIW